MSLKNFIWLNGEIIDGSSPALLTNNRAFLYGDGVFETIHAFGTQARHLSLHLARLHKSMKVIELEIPLFLNEQAIGDAIGKILNKNRIFGSARVRLTAYRESKGFYTPEQNIAGILIEAHPLENKMYEFNQQGYLIDIYTDIKKPVNKLSTIKSCNALIYVKAGLFRKSNQLDECVILNDQDRVSEAIASNIFIVKDGKIYTPSLAEGCIPGIMRELVCKIAPKLGFEVNSQVAFGVKTLLDSDEVFLTNSINGIRWVLGIKQSRYFNKVSKTLCEALNRYTFSDQFNDGFSG